MPNVGAGMSAAPHPTIALLQNNSLTMVVQQEIERAILAGEFGPGAKLNEAALALRLGVSRGPVREAFRMLDEAGLVRTEKNRGVFVRAIPLDEAIEIYELRAAMEESVGRRLAVHITVPQMQEAQGMVHAMEDAVKAGDAHRYHLLNLQFHDLMVEFTGNERLIAAYRQLVKELHLFRARGLVQGGGLAVSNAEHREMVAAIRARDPAQAFEVAYRHVEFGKARMIAALEG